jgi:hypothetical protein
MNKKPPHAGAQGGISGDTNIGFIYQNYYITI